MAPDADREAIQSLRNLALHGTAEEFGITPDRTVWGVVMDMGYPEAVVTLVSLADGTASLYFSTGGGVIGGHAHPAVNEAAQRFVQIAADQLRSFAPALEFPYATEGKVRFYVLTTRRVVTAEVAERALGEGDHPLSALFFAGHEVLSELRDITEAQEL